MVNSPAFTSFAKRSYVRFTSAGTTPADRTANISARLRVLLVDDDPIAGMALTAWLQDLGHQTVYAAGPVEADAAFETGDFDVVLSDVQMPGNFRLEWIERRLQAECPPPVLLMTGSPQLESAIRAANLPIAGYLLKPIDFKKTAPLLERLGQERRQRRALFSLAQEVARLTGQRPATSGDAAADELRELAGRLAAEASRPPRERGGETGGQPWLDAIVETIAVLEKTKHSFRSKELGELRKRLLQLVPGAAV